MYRTLAKEDQLQNIAPPPTFLLRSTVYSNMRPCVAALEKGGSNGWFMRTELQIIKVRSISNLPCLMLHFSTKEQSCTASNRNHTHWIRLPSTAQCWAHGEVFGLMVGRPCSRLVTVLNKTEINSTHRYYLNTKTPLVIYLGALSCLTATLIPRTSAHPPI